MAGLPIDYKEVLNAFGDIDAASQKPVTVAVLLDKTAPVDLLDFAKDCFASDAANARVAISYYEGSHAKLPHACDLVVVAAGLSEHTGRLAAAIRKGGTPVLVLTTLPGIVGELAAATGFPLIEDDIVSPVVAADPAALPEAGRTGAAVAEPYPFDAQAQASLRQAMGEWIVGVFKDKRLAFALCFSFVRKPLALDAVKATSAQNAAVGAVVLIPGADMPVMTLNQAKMVLQIAAAYGQKMGMERLKELAGVVAGGFALRTAARQVVGAVPGFGWAVKGIIGYAGTLAMGHAAIAFFEATVGQGRPVQEAMEAARAEAERIGAIAANEGNPASAAKAVAASYARSAASKAGDVAGRAIPAVQGVVGNVADAAGSTPVELGKKALDSFCEATGTTPAELGKKVARSVLAARQKNK